MKYQSLRQNLSVISIYSLIEILPWFLAKLLDNSLALKTSWKSATLIWVSLFKIYIRVLSLHFKTEKHASFLFYETNVIQITMYIKCVFYQYYSWSGEVAFLKVIYYDHDECHNVLSSGEGIMQCKSFLSQQKCRVLVPRFIHDLFPASW